MSHLLEQVNGCINPVVLHTCLQQTPICHVAGHQLSLLHFSEDLKCLIKLVLLTIGFYQYPICHWTWLDLGSMGCLRESCPWQSVLCGLSTLHLHLIEESQSRREISEADTHVHHAVVEYLVWPLSEVLGTKEHLI